MISLLCLRLLAIYFLTEIGVYIYFYKILVPWANTKPIALPDYRDWGRNRDKLFQRIVGRLERTIDWKQKHQYQKTTKSSSSSTSLDHLLENETSNLKKPEGFTFMLQSFLQSFFLHDCTSSSKSFKVRYNPYDKEHTNVEMKKGDIDALTSWAFFKKKFSELEPWELKMNEDMYKWMERTHGVTFKSGKNENLQPCLINVDPIQSSYKPLVFYFITRFMNGLSFLLLKLNGFQLYTASTGVRYWLRSSPEEEVYSKLSKKMPFIFFHGIAPGGYLLYLPLLWGILPERNPILLFENRCITCTMSFHAPSEQDIVEAVKESLFIHFGNVDKSKSEEEIKVILCGHSFGSCPVTWLIHAIPNQVHRIILLDPVTILLGTADIIINFVYRRYYKDSPNMMASSQPPLLSKYTSNNLDHKEELIQDQPCTQTFMSSEIGIEYYIRKHFSWYNSELWLEDIPNHVQVFVFLSGKDQIINPIKVKREIDIHNNAHRQQPKTVPSEKAREKSILTKQKRSMNALKDLSPAPPIQLTFWPLDGHGHCIESPLRWKEIKTKISKKI